jgi:cell division protein FtsL
MGSDWYTSDLQQVPNPKNQKLVFFRHAGVLAMLLAVLASLFIPVWQSAVNRSLSVALEAEGAQLQAMEEEHRNLRSQIASLSMPESLVDEAWRTNVSFKQIEADHLVMVARGN